MTLPLTDEHLATLRRLKAGPGRNKIQIAIDLAETTQVELARRAGMSQSYIADLSRGRYPSTTVQTAQRLAAVLGCEVDDLFPRPKRLTRLAS